MKTLCPHCSQHIEVDDGLAETTTICPTCKMEFTLSLGASKDATNNAAQENDNLLSYFLGFWRMRVQNQHKLVVGWVLVGLLFGFGSAFANFWTEISMSDDGRIPTKWVIAVVLLTTPFFLRIFFLARVQQNMKTRVLALVIFSLIMLIWLLMIGEPSLFAHCNWLSLPDMDRNELGGILVNPLWYKMLRALFSALPVVLILIVPMKKNKK